MTTQTAEHVCTENRKLTECLANSCGSDVYTCSVCDTTWEESCEHLECKYTPPTYLPEIRRTSRLLFADVLDGLKSIPSNSVHTVVTSPPYWGLRKYGLGAKEIGAEPTFGEFLERITSIFAEIKRVLHRTGTVWVNIGDSYNSKHSQGFFGDQSSYGRLPHGHERNTIKGMHSKNLIGQPWRVAFALQEAGWILRDDIPWVKPNCQPSSGKDRTTKSHEYVFLLAKQGNYFWDWKAVEEPAGKYQRLLKQINELLANNPARDEVVRILSEAIESKTDERRRRRSVWSIPTQSYKGAHYSTFPEELVSLCIQAGTSEMGCCPECLAPVVRLLRKDEENPIHHGGLRKRADAPGAETSSTSVYRTGITYKWETAGWAASCKHSFEQALPCMVLDPFAGSGTTGLVAANLKRHFVGIELSEKSIELASDRITQGCINRLFTDFSIEQVGSL